MGRSRRADQKWLCIPYRGNNIIVEAMDSIQQPINGKDFVVIEVWLILASSTCNSLDWHTPEHFHLIQPWLAPSQISLVIWLFFAKNNNNFLKKSISVPLQHFLPCHEEHSEHNLPWQAIIQATSTKIGEMFWFRLPVSHAGMSHCL